MENPYRFQNGMDMSMPFFKNGMVFTMPFFQIFKNGMVFKKNGMAVQVNLGAMTLNN